jgi:hypothetical protein
MENPIVGSTVVCAETGKAFVIETDGFTFNYATSRSDEILSDEGVHIRETRDLLDRSKKFFCYVNSDGKSIGGWKGNVLGTVTESWETGRKAFGGGYARFYRVTDVHGGKWTGYGNPGMCIALKAVQS